MSNEIVQNSPDPDLICPLLCDLFEDPVQLPCCGKAVSRLQIIQAVEYSSNCPLCRGNINNTDFTRLPTLRNLVGLVENVKNREVRTDNTLNEKDQWKATLTILKDDRSVYRSTISKLDISSKKVLYKTLVIPVIDRSGSMEGKPMTQVRYSLKRLVDLTYDNPNIITTVVTYDDRVDTYSITTATPRSYFDNIFTNIDARGGTSFKSAFNGIINVANMHSNVSDVSSMIIVFLTDGEDSSVRKEDRFHLVQTLKENIGKIWTKDFTIHSIGFGNNHDYDFLNALRLIGTEEGAYRYADPKEDDDILSGKINSVLDVILKSSYIPMKILPESNLQVITGSNGKFWVTNKLNNSPIIFTINDGEPISVIPEICESSELWTEWYSKLIDDIASELLILAKDNKSVILANNSDAGLKRELHIELLLRRSNAILIRLEPSSVNFMRLSSLIQTLDSIRKGENINEQKLNDMKFEGKFATKLSGNISIGSSSHISTPSINSVIPRNGYWDIINCKREKRLKADKKQLPLFVILGNYNNSNAIEWLRNHVVEIMSETQNGSNALHITASIGRLALTSEILSLNILNVNGINTDGYTPLDLSVLYGYWKTFDILIKHGAKLSQNGQLLLQTSISKGYWQIASRLLNSNYATITDYMLENVPTAEGLNWLNTYSNKDIAIEKAILKGSLDIVKNKISVTESVSWKGLEEVFVKSTNDYTSIVDLLLKSNKTIPQEIIPIAGDNKSSHNRNIEISSMTPDVSENEITWPLFIASEKGSLPMVKLLTKYLKKEEINYRNNKGTTCLWIAACNRHIDIVHELILHGANPNIPNFRGDSPLIPCCQKGSGTIVDLLLEAGIDMNLYNKERDNPVLICCRTGQDVILETLLIKHRELGNLDKILNYYAKIDGFPPLLAATELNKVGCIRICTKFGANLEWVTEDNNSILPGANALHLACHYGRLEAAKALYECGANITSKTKIGGYTPLHLAIRSGHSILVRYLLSRDKSALSIADDDGHIPEYYASMQGREDIKDEFFTDKLGLLFDRMLLDSTNSASQILIKYGQSLGCYEYSDFNTINMGQGSCLLSKSLIYGNIELATVLERIGFNPFVKDDYGLTPDFWKSYILGVPSETPDTIEKIDKVKSVISSSVQNRLLTNLSGPMGRPRLTDGPSLPVLNFRKKMSEGYNIKIHKSVLTKIRNSSEPSILGFLEKLKNNKIFPDGKGCLEEILWESRIHIVKLLASDLDNNLDPIQMMALYLYTGNATVCCQVNIALGNYNENNLWSPFIICLYQAVDKLPPLAIGTEVYRGVDYKFDPNIYTIGTKINWSSFSIASTDWRSSSEFIKDKRGIIFIIKSQTGKSVSKYSRNPVDSEVIFLPGTTFIITAIYRPDIIALGQANIRGTTFTARETDIRKAEENLASIIIEIEELV